MASELHQVADLLLEHRAGEEDWGEISTLRCELCPKKIANRFLVCCLLDWQMRAGRAWRNGERLVDEILGDPEDLWREITSIEEDVWKSKFTEYKLHRYPAGHNRLWSIGKKIRDKYDGDAGRIWRGKESPAVLLDLLALGAGEQISRMIVGALHDCCQVKDPGDDLSDADRWLDAQLEALSKGTIALGEMKRNIRERILESYRSGLIASGRIRQVKADVHVCCVLGRVAYGKEMSAPAATELARQLNPMDPWQLDWPLWNVGKDYCTPQNPDCGRCYLAPHCAYNLHRVEASTA
jgi:endonuclease-3